MSVDGGVVKDLWLDSDGDWQEMGKEGRLCNAAGLRRCAERLRGRAQDASIASIVRLQASTEEEIARTVMMGFLGSLALMQYLLVTSFAGDVHRARSDPE